MPNDRDERDADDRDKAILAGLVVAAVAWIAYTFGRKDAMRDFVDMCGVIARRRPPIVEREAPA